MTSVKAWFAFLIIPSVNLDRRHKLEQTPGDGEGQGSLHAIIHGVTKSWKPLSD